MTRRGTKPGPGHYEAIGDGTWENSLFQGTRLNIQDLGDSSHTPSLLHSASQMGPDQAKEGRRVKRAQVPAANRRICSVKWGAVGSLSQPGPPTAAGFHCKYLSSAREKGGSADLVPQTRENSRKI